MTIKAILFDIDGTLTERGAAIPGAAAALAHVRARGIAVRFLTNTTGRTPANLAAELCRLGISVEASEVQTATSACAKMLAGRPGVRCHLMVPPDVESMFEGVARDDDHPDVVVLSDIGDGFTYAALNRAFLMLRNGAELIALQRNLFWFDTDTIKLDCGAFVLALEAASKKKATVTGKPALSFFKTALAGLACTEEQVLVIGDDLGTDIAGGHGAGLKTVLVGTGKYADGQTSHPGVEQDYFLESIDGLPRLLAQLA